MSGRKIKIALSAFISVMVLLINYLVGNTSIPLPDEMQILQGWDKFLSFSGASQDSIPNEVMLIDLAYDKQFVDYFDEDSFYVGQHIISDRKKIYDFLTLVQKANNYKYIMLDVIFEKGDKSPYDSLLFRLISHMNRIVVASHEDKDLQDSMLLSKAANADYTTTWKETNFSRYQYIHNGLPSIPLRMYQEIDHHDIKKWGMFYFSCGWLCRNSVTLKLPYRVTSVISENEEQNKYDMNLLNLGSDLLDINSTWSIEKEIKDKILVLGDFKHDVHETYAGILSGSIINLNAYYALKRGDHILLGYCGITLIFFLLIACFYYKLSMLYFSNFKLSNFTDKKWLQIALSPVSISVVFLIIAFVAYKPFGIVYKVWIPIGVFSILDFITNIYFTYKENKNEKNKVSNTTVAPVNNDCECCKLQNSETESSSNTD